MSNDFTPILSSLAKAALAGKPVEKIVQGLCEGINETGFGIDRALVGVAALHPGMRAFNIEWRVGAPATRETIPHAQPEAGAWLNSPLYHMLTHGLTVMRQRLDRPHDTLPFPAFRELAAEGMTDYIAAIQSFGWSSDFVPGGEFGIAVSLTTRRPGGFRDQDVVDLQTLAPPLAHAIKSSFMDTIAHDVLGAYLGADAAARVLAGSITRGSVTEIPAVVMMADIKNFTRLSNARPIAEVLTLVNAVFDCVSEAVQSRGGEILKFLGDGVLAIFLLQGRDHAAAAADALDAAEAIQATLPSDAAIDIGLNIGNVHYGNVGASGRLDFTAIGPAVNEAARLEALCDETKRSILVSGALAAVTPEPWRSRLVALGAHRLKGFDTPRTVFGIGR